MNRDTLQQRLATRRTRCEERADDPGEHTDPAIKQDAMDRTAPLNTKLGRYHPDDDVMAFHGSL